MTEQPEPRKRPSPEELDNSQITPEMVASWAAYDKIEEAKARQQRQQEHELEVIEKELIADGLTGQGAKSVAPEIREERVRADATERARLNQEQAKRQIHQMF